MSTLLFSVISNEKNGFAVDYEQECFQCRFRVHGQCVSLCETSVFVVCVCVCVRACVCVCVKKREVILSWRRENNNNKSQPCTNQLRCPPGVKQCCSIPIFSMGQIGLTFDCQGAFNFFHYLIEVIIVLCNFCVSFL